MVFKSKTEIDDKARKQQPAAGSPQDLEDAELKVDEVKVEEEEESNLRQFTGYKAKVVTVVAIAMSLYCILFVTRVFDNLGFFIPTLSHTAIFLAFLLALGFMLLPIRKGQRKDKLPWYDLVFLVLSIAAPIYLFFTWNINANRYTFMNFYPFEIALGVLTTLGVLEITRRSLGLAMPIVALVFLAHALLGNNLTGVLKVRKIGLSEAVGNMIYHNVGIFGTALETAAAIIVMFIIFSQFLFLIGGGDWFMKLAISVAGRFRGGPAKVAVLSSAFMGMMSGSTTANVATTGVFTIPLMKKSGFRPEYAGAVEAVSSNGGQIMPPIMGLVAFVMADWLGISYWSIAVMAIIPALLYFSSVMIMIDCESRRLGIKGLPREQCGKASYFLRHGWYYLLPIAALIFFLGALRYSAERSVCYAIAVLLAIMVVKELGKMIKRTERVKDSLLSMLRLCLNALKNAALGVMQPGIACACAGIIIGSLTLTQTGLIISDAMVTLAGSNMLLLLIMAALCCFIFGMGMSSLPAYMLVALFVAPALSKFGVPDICSHFFIFWFAIVSFITPPVALGSYVAAGIAGAKPLQTSVQSTRLGFCSFTLPFLFVYNPALLMSGTPLEVVIAVVTGLIGVTYVAFGLSGYSLTKIGMLQRVAFVALGLVLVGTNGIWSAAAIAVGAVLMVLQHFTHKKTQTSAA